MHTSMCIDIDPIDMLVASLRALTIHDDLMDIDILTDDDILMTDASKFVEEPLDDPMDGSFLNSADEDPMEIDDEDCPMYCLEDDIEKLVPALHRLAIRGKTRRPRRARLVWSGT